MKRMGGFFGVASKNNCILELFYGIDYHSHLGTRRGGMAVCGERGFQRAIHNIENSPFRTKFERDVEEMEGNLGIGCISDYEPQPLLIQSHLGSFAITTVGKINNMDELLKLVYENGNTHFQEMSSGQVNATELVAALICKKESIVEGIRYVQELVDGSMTLLLMTKKGLYAARDRYGRTPLVIGHKEDAYCVAFESFSYINLGYDDYRELGPGEIVFIDPDGVKTLVEPGKEMRICSFLWVYYGYPTSAYEGVNVEEMRYKCGAMLAKRDKGQVSPDVVAGVPDSGIAHAIGYANESGIPYARPFIKYTPTWPRSFMPTQQSQRNLIAKMKLIPVKALIQNKKLLLIDDSIVRGTQLRETTEFLYASGAKEVHVRPACPPLLYGCKYLNFSRSKSELDLITRRVIREREGEHVSQEVLDDYANPCSKRYEAMLEAVRKEQNFTTLRYHRLDDLREAINISPCKLCTYCFNGKE
jgi:amidophosphoribosyltransferase